MAIEYDPVWPTESVLGGRHNSSPSRWTERWRLPTGWRGLVTVSTILAIAALLINFSLLIWGVSNPADSETGFRTVSQGSCPSIRTRYTILAVAVNVLSTLLLACSNVCIQVLAAPSRGEIEEAHARGRWLCIGISSLRNFRGRKRVILCCLLGLSSFPLHVLYNSVFNQRLVGWKSVILASDDAFASGPVISVNAQESFGQPSLSIFNDANTTLDFIQDFQRQVIAGKTDRLSWQDCIRSAQQGLISEYDTYVLVTSGSNSTSPLAGWTYLDIEGTITDVGMMTNWICNGDYEPLNQYDEIGFTGDQAQPCPNVVLKDTEWKLQLPWFCADSDGLNGGMDYAQSTKCGQQAFVVDHCYARPAQASCSISFNTSLMIAVVAANAIKIACFFATLFWDPWPTSPLVTIGDAVASFLSEPDPHTAGLGPVSIKDFKKPKKAKPKRKAKAKLPKTNHRATHVWIRWTIAMFILCILLLLNSGSFAYLSGAVSFPGLQYAQFVSHDSLPLSISVYSLLVNLPQLVLSLLYVFYNNLFTAMHITKEYFEFVPGPKPLRVSHHSGQQRSSYWLQLPFWYSVPLVTTMAVMHWLLSETLFVVDLTLLAPRRFVPSIASNDFEQDKMLRTVATNPTPSVFCFPIVLFLTLLLLIFGLRRLPRGMPAISTCSIALAAACQRHRDDPPDMVLRPIRYGLVRGRTIHESDYYGFSSQLDRVEQVDELPSAQEALHVYLKRARTRSPAIGMKRARIQAATDSEVELVPLAGLGAAMPESTSLKEEPKTAFGTRYYRVSQGKELF